MYFEIKSGKIETGMKMHDMRRDPSGYGVMQLFHSSPGLKATLTLELLLFLLVTYSLYCMYQSTAMQVICIPLPMFDLRIAYCNFTGRYASIELQKITETYEYDYRQR